MTRLRLNGVSKSFGGTQVLHDVDVEVPGGSLTAILGPSGCGKTTMLRLIAGFLDPDTGSIEFDDKIVFDQTHRVPPQRRRVGYVPQEGALFPHLDVAANIGFGLRRSDRRDHRTVDELLELVGLPVSMRTRRPDELSGGQQQRIALARALAPAPSVVLLDEPFASLDAGLREETGRAVARALRQTKATAILVTHDQSEALSLADQVAVMREGRLIQIAEPRLLYTAPADAGVAAFVGSGALLDVSIDTLGHVASALGPLTVSSDNRLPVLTGPARVVVRPEQIQLTSLDVGVPALVTDVSYYGHDAAVRLSINAVPSLAVTSRVLGHHAPRPGDMVGLEVIGDVIRLGPEPATS